MRMEGEPAKNPSFWTKDTKIEQVYAKVGNFWLPRSNRSTTTFAWEAAPCSPSITGTIRLLPPLHPSGQGTLLRDIDSRML